MLQPIERRLPLFATFLSFVFSGGLLMGSNGYLPPPPGRAKVAQTPGRARVIIQHGRIFGSQNRHTDMKEPTEGQGWRIGMKRPEQPTKINETDYPGKTAPALVTADVVLSIPPPPPPPNRLWYLPYLGIRSSLVAATASMSGCPATANIFDGTAWSLLLTDRGRLHSLI